jgi:hypothetical protein
LSEVEFHSKIPAVAPTEVKLESAALIIDKRQPQTFVFAHGPIPAAVRLRILIGKSTDSRKWLITDANHVVVEVMKWIAHVPHEFAATFALSIPGRRHRIICIFEPPDWVRLLTGAEFVARNVMENFLGFVRCDRWGERPDWATFVFSAARGATRTGQDARPTDIPASKTHNKTVPALFT